VQPGIALVTGGAAGIGRAVTQRLIEDGYQLVVIDTQPAQLPDAVAFVQGDQREESAWQAALAASLERFGAAPSALVLNAAMGGAGVVGDIETVSLERWREVFDVNVTGSVLGLRACLPAMVAAGSGSIVLMASVDAFLAEQGAVAYACSKATLLQLGRCVAVDYARRGVRVNVVCPGIVDTPGFRAHLSTASDPQRFEDYRTQRTPIARFLAPAEVAGVVSFLLGDDASGMTGSAVVVDGGLTASYDFRSGEEGA
jgi:NAD(P)-dependent dehydrogenase (short-subunit alcohol dehydrogenase family)